MHFVTFSSLSLQSNYFQTFESIEQISANFRIDSSTRIDYDCVAILRDVDQPFQREALESRSVKGLRLKITKVAFPLLGLAYLWLSLALRLPFNLSPANYHP